MPFKFKKVFHAKVNHIAFINLPVFGTERFLSTAALAEIREVIRAKKIPRLHGGPFIKNVPNKLFSHLAFDVFDSFADGG